MMSSSSNIGPTKRSADHNDYVELESNLAKANEEIRRLKDYNRSLIKTLNARDRQIKDNESQVKFSDPNLVTEINEYTKLRDSALSLRKENNEKSINFNNKGESGSYSTPPNVIDAGLTWTKKAIAICENLSEKLGLNK
jgi:hypothetical protein